MSRLYGSNFSFHSSFWEELREKGARVFPVGKGPEKRPILCAGFGNLHRAALFCSDFTTWKDQSQDSGPAGAILGRLCRDLALCCNGEAPGPLRGLSVARGLEDQGVLLLPQLPGPAFAQNLPFPQQNHPGAQALRRVCKSFSLRHMICLRPGEKGIRWECGQKQSPKAVILGQLLCSSSGLPSIPKDPLCCSPADWFSDCFGRPAFEIGLGQIQGTGEETALYARLLATLVIATLV